MTQLVSSKTVRARKAHLCNACGSVAVRPGETYLRQCSVDDAGSAYTWVACAPCRQLLPKVFEWHDDYENGVGAEDFREWADEHRDDPDLGGQARAYLARAGVV